MRKAVTDEADLLRVGGVHHAQNELNDGAVELQTSAEQIVIQQAHVRTGFGSHKSLTRQSHTININCGYVYSSKKPSESPAVEGKRLDWWGPQWVQSFDRSAAAADG